MSVDKQEQSKNFFKTWAHTIIGMATGAGEKHKDLLPLGVTDVQVTISRSTEKEIGVKNQNVVSSESGMSQGVSITLYSGQKKLNFYLNSLNSDSLKKAIEENVIALSYVPEDEFAGLLPKEDVFKGADKDFDVVDATSVSDEKLIRFAKEMEQGAKTVNSYKNSRTIAISSSEYESMTIATNGVERFRSGTNFTAMITPIAEKPLKNSNDVERQVDYDYTSTVHFDDLENPMAIGIRAVKAAEAKLGSTQPDSEELTVILSQSAASGFFGNAISAMDGNAVYKGATFLKDKLGKQIFADNITILDDPHVQKSTASMTRDSAGLEVKPLKLVDNGILKLFNINLEEGRKLGMDPIGRQNGLTNVSVTGGQRSVDDLIADVEKGIYVLGFNGGTIKIDDGSYSREAYGFMIEDGKVREDKPVSGFTVAGNLENMMLAAEIANDTPTLPNRKTNLAAPTTRINKLKIGGK
ncbi:MAG: hypothetical protein CMP22_00940 [Rickettsiales bacterium]|nr:hypothetical protein [Rickettsiales bacterium]